MQSPAPQPETQPARRGLRVGKTIVETGGKESEVFTLSLDSETIELLPLRNWSQLDFYKWTSRGKLPGTPSGLEITSDHVKIAGETVALSDPEGVAKLEKLLAEWLELENQTLALARQKAQPKAAPKPADETAVPEHLHYTVDAEKGQVHIRCIQGKETLAMIGLNQRGFESLVNQGLLRKPHGLKVGALHDWVELDGRMFSFEAGRNDSAELQQCLNEKYVPDSSLGKGKDVVVYANPASSTGFDIQFPVRAGGVMENKKRPFGEEALDLLQDPDRCGILHKGLVIKIARPHLIFKQKVADGGERYLDKVPDNCVVLTDDDGNEKVIDLSQPVNYMRLSPVEMTAVFNHPALHRHTKTPARAVPGPKPPNTAPPAGLSPAPAAPAAVPKPPLRLAPKDTFPLPRPLTLPSPAPAATMAPPPPAPPPAPVFAGNEEPFAEPDIAEPELEPDPPPNQWLETVLSRPSIRYDWFTCLVYGKVAQHFGNSLEGKVGISHCWAVALGETRDLDDPGFTGIFLTDKHGIGYLKGEHMTRFNKGVAFIGVPESAIEGINVNLIALALDKQQRPVFIVNDDYRSLFGVPEQTVQKELELLTQYGALIMSVSEALASEDVIDVVWTVPAEQENPRDPQALESWAPEEPGAGI